MDTFTINNLSFYYPEQSQAALDGLSLSVAQGEFLTICGPSGCGKTTLLRQLKTVLAPHGRLSGELLFEGQPLHELPLEQQAARIGFVLQNPDNQVVTDKVWHELAFGLESLGLDNQTIRRRVAEMASFFGIESWFYTDVSELSGGQKQLLNLASIMAMQPTVLLLDEPTSQLDPIAAADFLAIIGKINRELGTTIILTEHRLEEALPLSTRVAVLDHGHVICSGTAEEVGSCLRGQNHAMQLALPTPMRVWAAVESSLPCPITVRDGRAWLEQVAAELQLSQPLPANLPEPGTEAVRLDEVWFRYEKDTPDVVKGLTLSARRGEFLAILGGNGAGKTTALSLINGLRKPYRGSIEVTGRVATLPQNPQTLFVKKTLREDLREIFGSKEAAQDEEERLARVVGLCRLEQLLERHPFDLSGGEQQRAALAKVLLLDPDILLLDEPTKGLDAEYKQVFAQILNTLLGRGVAIIMVSHDIEFCAKYAHRCALFFDGAIVTGDEPRRFFSGNSFYTTAANRMVRRLLPDAITAEDVIHACHGQVPPEQPLPEEPRPLPPLPEQSSHAKPSKLPLWRKILAALAGAASLTIFILTIAGADLPTLISANGPGGEGGSILPYYALLIGSLAVMLAALGHRAPVLAEADYEHSTRHKLPKRTTIAMIVILLLVPLTILIGSAYFGDRKYYIIALLVMLEAMLPFALSFEGRRPQAREVVVIAVLVAIGVAGRAAFFALPSFKPVTALTIIAGLAFGGETGFLVGALTMLVSNIMFSQGPWTPFQMFAMGLIGLLAGLLFRKGWLRRTKASLCVFGALAVLLVYGGLMNPSSALVWMHTLNWKIVLTYYVTGFPFDIVHAASTVFFLWVAAEPMLEKLERIKTKYGLMS